MIKRFLIAILALQMVSPLAFAMEVGNVHLPDSLKVGENSLILNGAGFRKKLFIKVYAGGLYLQEKQSDPGVIIEADEPMAIRMHFVYHKVSGKKLIKAWNEGFEKATEGNVASLKSRIETFNSFFKEDAKKNDIYDLIYIPGHGVDVYIKRALAGTVQGLDFKKALFAIWLGDKPADSRLKKKMLGK